jgi:hypothetical protein
MEALYVCLNSMGCGDKEPMRNDVYWDYIFGVSSQLLVGMATSDNKEKFRKMH